MMGVVRGLPYGVFLGGCGTGDGVVAEMLDTVGFWSGCRACFHAVIACGVCHAREGDVARIFVADHRVASRYMTAPEAEAMLQRRIRRN